jgi:hypothetical protein
MEGISLGKLLVLKLGDSLGPFEGDLLGFSLGFSDRNSLGEFDGLTEGTPLRISLGLKDEKLLGSLLINLEGFTDGE